MDIPARGWKLADISSDQCRDEVVRFWLSVPLDQLEAFWAGPMGKITRHLVSKLSHSYEFTSAQIELRNALNNCIGNMGFSDPYSHQLILALFLLSPPGLFKISNPSANLPSWLLVSYQELYEINERNITVLGEPDNHQDGNNEYLALPNPDFGVFPNTLEELLANRVQLNRMLGLSNLFYIDPDDLDITAELITFRRSLSKLIDSAPESDLQRIWATDFGDNYWALVRSGIQNVAIDSSDQQIKATMTARLTPPGGGFGSPNALNAFLIALMYYSPSQLRINSPERQLPAWLMKAYSQIAEQSAALNI